VSNPYVLPGLAVADMLDRSQIFKAICSDLGEKATPDHVSIVGPKYFGKTVLSNKIASYFREVGSPYQIVCYWDLKHGTPESNATFLVELAKRLDAGLLGIGVRDYHEYLIETGEALGGNIDTVLLELDAKEIRVLFLLDDFDKLAAQPHITKNLWDYLRSMAQRSNLRFVTTSRKRLRDLIPSHDARTSDFWNIFSSTKTLKPIEPSGFDDFVAPLVRAGWSFEDSARKEFFNWTGGIPVLASLVCNEIWEKAEKGTLTKPTIDSLCERILAERSQDYLKDLWEDLPNETQGDLIDLAGNLSHAKNLKPQRQQVLIDRGYLLQEGPTFRPSCLFMKHFASKEDIRSRDVRELFKDAESDLRSLKGLLELKLNQVEGGNADIRSYIELAIEGLSRGQKAALLALRSVAQEAIGVAWEAEFPGGVIPATALQKLTLDKPQGGGGLDPKNFNKLSELNVRRNILRVAAGSQNGAKVSTKVTRPLMLMIDALYNIGNFGQHMNDIPEALEKRVDIGFCVTACWTAIELHKRMAMDLK
jgi:hypothetical protein